jgi:hypothetical protein
MYPLEYSNDASGVTHVLGLLPKSASPWTTGSVEGSSNRSSLMSAQGGKSPLEV